MSLADPNLESLVQDAERSASDAALRVLGDALVDASEADRLMLLRRWTEAAREVAKRRRMLQPQTLAQTMVTEARLEREPAAALQWAWDSMEREIHHELARLMRANEWYAIRLRRQDREAQPFAYRPNGNRELRLEMDVDPLGR